MKVDDGFTGSNFDRPAFQEMLAEVRTGHINCIVVKDLSRFWQGSFGRRGIHRADFSLLGVRFIAINDHYDSLHRKRGIR